MLQQRATLNHPWVHTSDGSLLTAERYACGPLMHAPAWLIAIRMLLNKILSRNGASLDLHQQNGDLNLSHPQPHCNVDCVYVPEGFTGSLKQCGKTPGVEWFHEDKQAEAQKLLKSSGSSDGNLTRSDVIWRFPIHRGFGWSRKTFL